MPRNIVFARHALHSRKQQTGETVNQYYNALKSLARECDFKDVTAVQHQEECICYAFVIGIFSSIIRQRLLERDELPLH